MSNNDMTGNNINSMRSILKWCKTKVKCASCNKPLKKRADGQFNKCTYSLSCWEFDDNMDATLETSKPDSVWRKQNQTHYWHVRKKQLAVSHLPCWLFPLVSCLYAKLRYPVTSSRLHTKRTEMRVLLILLSVCDGSDCMHTVHALTWCCPDTQSLVWEWPCDGTSYKERCRGRLHSAETHRHPHKLIFCNKPN